MVQNAVTIDLTAPLTFQERANLLRTVRVNTSFICGSCRVREQSLNLNHDSEYGFVCVGCRGALAVTRGQ
jgi:hypothetical protein